MMSAPPKCTEATRSRTCTSCACYWRGSALHRSHCLHPAKAFRLVQTRNAVQSSCHLFLSSLTCNRTQKIKQHLKKHDVPSPELHSREKLMSPVWQSKFSRTAWRPHCCQSKKILDRRHSLMVQQSAPSSRSQRLLHQKDEGDQLHQLFFLAITPLLFRAAAARLYCLFTLGPLLAASYRVTTILFYITMQPTRHPLRAST